MNRNQSQNRTWNERLLKLFSVAILTTSVGCSIFGKSTNSATGPGGYSGYGATSVDEKTLKEFAPPAVPPAVTKFVRNILEVQTPGAGMILPGPKKPLFFTWAITGTPQIWKLETPLSFPIQMTSGADATSVVDVTADGRFVVVSRDRAGEEYPGLYLLPAEGGALIEIQHKPKVQTTYAWSTNDAETFYFMANDVKPDSFALHAYSLKTKKNEVIFSEDGTWFVADTFGDNTFLMGKAKSPFASEYWVFRVGDKTLIPVIGQDEWVDYQVAFGSRPGEFFILTNKSSEYRSLYYAKQGRLQKITIDDNNEINGFKVDHIRYRVYLEKNVAGRTETEVLDGKTFDTIKFPAFEGADQTNVVSVSRMGRFATLRVESSNMVPTNYVYDWSSSQLTNWMRTGLPEMEASAFRKSTLEFYPARDGAKIPMFVTRPAKCAADPCPVIVSFHGGPESQSQPFFNRRAQVFAAAGFIYAEPNVRGSTGYGKSYRAADDGPKRLNVITDIEDASLYIKKAWAKKGKAPKIGVTGGSYGGYSTLMAMTRFAGAYDAGVSIVGMSNLKSFLMNTAPYRRALRIAEYGDPVQDAEALEKLSPTTYLDQVKAPLLMIQGLSDPRVPAGEAIQMQSLLKKRGLDSSLILIPNEGHGSRTRDNQVQELGQTLMFFQRHLLK